MYRILVIFCVLIFVCPVMAKKRYFNSMSSFYSEYKEVKKRKCQNCHAKTSLKLNEYGKDFAALLSDFSNVKDIFVELELEDSDEDGALNFDEIEEGTHPGVAKK